MKVLIQLMIIALLMAVAAPAYSGSAVYVLKCTENDDADEEEILAVVEKWLKAAKTQKGGENMEASVSHPVAAQMGEVDFLFSIRVPSFAAWGEFIDGYKDSPANQVDADFGNLASCADSALWESTSFK